MNIDSVSPEALKNTINQARIQLIQVNIAILTTPEGEERNDFLKLRKDIEELIELSKEGIQNESLPNQLPNSSGQSSLDDEYLLFMKEMAKEGAIEQPKLKFQEGQTCQAPYLHSWGDTIFHNAMISCILPNEEESTQHETKVKVLFINPTHQEMLPCPYLLNGGCRFTDDKCKFSHGEIALLSNLQEYKEPNFDNVKIGSRVLAKNANNLWQGAIIKNKHDNNCVVKFEINQEEYIKPLRDILPLDSNNNNNCDTLSNSGSESESEEYIEWVVEKSLLKNPPTDKLGDWEKHTKGIGSKLMQKMGYIIGTGLGKHADGRLEPVQAEILPAGKSLDHCMILRENAGNDENLFSVERRLKKLQKQQEARNQREYNREKPKNNVFEFLNETVLNTSTSKSNSKNVNKTENRQKLKSETDRNLNITSLKIEEDIKKVQIDLLKIKELLIKHSNPNTAMNKNLRSKLISKQEELKKLNDYSKNIKSEQKHRYDTKKLTVF